MRNGIEIVPYNSSYLEKAIALTYAAWTPIFEKYAEVLGEKMYNDLFGDWKDMKYKRIYEGLNSGRGYVALVDGEFAGFVFYVVDEEKREGILEENAVSAQFRGMGIAKVMYEYVFEKMRAEGLRYVMVATGLDEAHAPARKAYQKVGFEQELPSVRYFKEL